MSTTEQTTEAKLREALDNILNYVLMIHNQRYPVIKEAKRALALPPGLEETLAGLKSKDYFEIITEEEKIHVKVSVEPMYIYVKTTVDRVEELAAAIRTMTEGE